ncbi:MAG: aminomethyl-transferring glycine dehydrogenase subunit GcvPA [Andreesenia angusta]|nr:aminomethyl-transferring glycine dehydrogenase subunit GcvPA [Andreesenia angusta]
MHRYISSTKKEQEEMLKSIGASSIEDLFSDIPEDLKFKGELQVGEPLSELELRNKLGKLAKKNQSDLVCFLGAGAYDRFIPGVINHMALRQEFFTAYTPYQPEVSQGTLTGIFEFQTMISSLTGMDVTNASLYDGPTATGEAVSMACDQARRDKIVVSATLGEDLIKVIKTNCEVKDIEVIVAPMKDGVTDIEATKELMTKEVAGLVVKSPNFFGIIEDLDELEKVAHSDKKSLFIVNTDPISLGILKKPGDCGADIVVGEGQSLGIPLSYGGPYLGFFSTTKKLVRKIPGRIVGLTEDNDGNRGLVLTLQAREQHIRRYKATSNICSNQGLIMLMATIYMSLMGKEGIKEVANQTVQKAHYAYKKLTEGGKFKPLFPDKPFFQEFALKADVDIKKLNEKLLENGILGGYELGKDYKEYENGVLICVTEKRTKEEIDELARIMEAI